MSESASFEKALEKLEKIVSALEDSELPLDKSLKLFEEGIGQVRLCEKKLKSAEGKLEKLIDKAALKKEAFEV